MKYIKLYEELSSKRIIDLLTKYYKSCEDSLKKNKIYSLSTTRISNISNKLNEILSNKVKNNPSYLSEIESTQIIENDTFISLSKKEITKIKSIIPYIFKVTVEQEDNFDTENNSYEIDYLCISFFNRINFFNKNKIFLKQRDKINTSLSDAFDEVQDEGYILFSIFIKKMKDDYYFVTITITDDYEEDEDFYFKADQLSGLIQLLKNIIY